MSTAWNPDKSTSIIYKIKPDGLLIWDFKLEGNAIVPVAIFKNSIFVYDFYVSNDGSSYLKRISKDGTLMWSRAFKGNIWSSPLVLEGENRIVFGITSSYGFLRRKRANKLMIVDPDGNTLKEDLIQDPNSLVTTEFYGDSHQNTYAFSNMSVVAFDKEFAFKWRFKPENPPFPAEVPIADANGNLYFKMTGLNLASLNNEGKLRWIKKTGGDIGYQPVLLNNGQILMITSKHIDTEPGEIRDDTYLEVFTTDGDKQFLGELPGSIIQTQKIEDNNIIFVLGCNRGFPSEERTDKSLRIYSLTIPF